jgi:mannose-6-phosphate isomerase-like protein (cupin superfamily)
MTEQARMSERSVSAWAKGTQRCMYTLWGLEEPENWMWESVPNVDLVDSVVEGTGRRDWRLLRPFDLPGADVPDRSFRLLYDSEFVRVGREVFSGPQPWFERAGDFDTVLFQFAGHGLVETSFGRFALSPGQALHIPAMVAHRTVGSPSCRRVVFLVKDRLAVKLDPEASVTETAFEVVAEGVSAGSERVPEPVEPADGKVREHLTHWHSRPEEEFLFERTYGYMVGRAEQGPRPTLLRPFDYFEGPPGEPVPPVRTATLWESPNFRQRVYANPGRQPVVHRGYDEDEMWFQFGGYIEQETEHEAYTVGMGEMSMAEAGISHTSTSNASAYRLTTYTNRPLRMVVDPAEATQHTTWQLNPTMIRDWPSRQAQVNAVV